MSMGGWIICLLFNASGNRLGLVPEQVHMYIIN
jgi:hypothetical protein